MIASRTPLVQTFSPTKKIGSYLQIDDTHKAFKAGGSIFEFSNLLNFELLEDGETITKGGLGRAIAGGLLFGGVGAIVGGVTGGKKSKGVCNSMRLKITLRNCHCSMVYIPVSYTHLFKKAAAKPFLRYEPGVPIVILDCYSKVQFESSQKRSEGEVTKNVATLRHEHLAFLDYDAIYSELQRYKTEKARYNVNITRQDLRDLLQNNQWYKLLILSLIHI